MTVSSSRGGDSDIVRTPCEDKNRERADVSTSQGRLKIASRSPEARRLAQKKEPTLPTP